MSELRYSTHSTSDFPEDQERCCNCGVILTGNHQCLKWKARSRGTKSRRNHYRHRHRDGTSSSQSFISERRSNEKKSVGTQTDAVPNSRISTATQTEDIDQNEDETYKELSRNIFEKMICHKFLLLDLHNVCNRLEQ